MMIDFVIGQKENPYSKKMEDVLERVCIPEIDMSLLEMLAPDMGVTRIAQHCAAHIQGSARAEQFVDYYKKWVSPIYRSGRSG